jgi:hypothetical protein
VRRKEMVDFGRELDGAEPVYSYLETWPGPDIWSILIYVVEDCCAGSDRDAHWAVLEAMEYLQTGSRIMQFDFLNLAITSKRFYLYTFL